MQKIFSLIILVGIKYLLLFLFYIFNNPLMTVF